MGERRSDTGGRHRPALAALVVAALSTVGLAATSVAPSSAGPTLDAAVSGIVTDVGGNPVEGASVSVCVPPVLSGCGGPGSAETGADGSYAFGPFEAGTYDLVMTPPSPFFPRVTVRGVSFSAGATVTQDFVLDLGGTVSGTVTDPSGDPVAGVGVRVGPRPLGSWDTREATTGSDGRSGTYVDGGSYQATITGTGPADYGDQAFTVAADLSDPGSAQNSIATTIRVGKTVIAVTYGRTAGTEQSTIDFAQVATDRLEETLS